MTTTDHSPIAARELRILAIAGSLRRASFNRRLLDAAKSLAPDGMRMDIYPALASIPLFDEDLEAKTGGGPDAVRGLRAAVARADGLLIATPEYNQSIPGVLKNVIDWLSRPAPVEVLVGKPVAILGATSGRWGTRLAQAALRQVLTATECVVMPTPSLFVRDAESLFDAGGALRDANTIASLRSLLAAYSDGLSRCRMPGQTVTA